MSSQINVLATSYNQLNSTCISHRITTSKVNIKHYCHFSTTKSQYSLPISITTSNTYQLFGYTIYLHPARSTNKLLVEITVTNKAILRKETCKNRI